MSDSLPPMTDEALAAFAETAPERIDCDLWTLLDWSLWGAGLADTLRVPLASTMVAAIPAEVRAQAEMVMAAWLKHRDVESPSRTNAELRKELAEARSECAALAAKVEEFQGAHKVASRAADRFRDVVAEYLGLESNPGDDALVAELRERGGFTGPEPTRWRDFLTGARAQIDQIEAERSDAASGMPHTPAQEADALAKHEAAIAEYVRACKAEGCSCYPIASNTKVISHWCRIHGVLSIVPAELTWTNPGIRGGEPCMRGTRVPVEQVCTLLEDGATWEFVKETYPSIPTPEGHREATQPGADGTNTSSAGSGRGTGVTEAQASDG